MRFASVGPDPDLRAVVVVDDLVFPFPQDVTVLSLVQGGLHEALEMGARVVSTARPQRLADVRLAPPLRPPSVRDFITFERHVEGALRTVVPGATVPAEWYDAPAFYFTSPHALIGAHDDVELPPSCELLDMELEVAAVVGRDARNATPQEAELFGYCVFNDWSARDLQRREMKVGLGPCKGKDFASTLGPWITTAEELPSLDLLMTVAVNDVEVGRDRLSSMAWTFPELVSYASRGAWVRAGDVLGSGTCGNGCLAELWGRSGVQTPPPLVAGDVVTMTVEGLGRISNRVVPGLAGTPVPRARSDRNVQWPFTDVD